MLVSSQNGEHHSPASKVKNTTEQQGSLRGSLGVRALDSNDDNSVDSVDSISDSVSNSNERALEDSVDSTSDSISNSNSRKK